MGLAGKLASVQGGIPPAGSSYQPPQQSNQKTGAQNPNQQNYQAYTPGPAQGNYGGQQSYQQPQPPRITPQSHGGPQDIAIYKALLQRQVQEKNLQAFYPANSPALDQIATRASQQINQFCSQWRLPLEIGRDIAKLGLYDIVLYIDDSGSMIMEEGGDRINDLHLILNRVAAAATLFDDDGIDIRFMNSNLSRDKVKSEVQIEELMRTVKFQGLTPLGSKLRERVIDGIVLRNAQERTMLKPYLVITITDGAPTRETLGTDSNTIFETIKYARNELRRYNLGTGAIAFQFAQVGNEPKATAFLAKLDNDPSIGDIVDCTSNFESESAEMLKQNPPVDLTPELWLVKLLLGAIDSSYDSQDEQGTNHPQGQQRPQYQSQQYQGYGAPQGQQGYGAPQGQQGYGAPQGYQSYGAPPPGGYAPPPGPPPNYQQQYQYGNQPQQGQYGNQQQYAPPIPYGKPGQGSGYQQPPPPPRY